MTPVTVLDGGLSTALEARGADLSGPLWTARLLGVEPWRIAAAHREFYLAGARVATAASYQVSVEGLVAAGHDTEEARRLVGRSVALARDVRDELAAVRPGLLAVETIPDSDEAEVLVPLLDEVGLPSWFSYSVRGAETNAGQPLAEAYAVVADSRSVVAAGVNCSDQADVLGAVRAAVAATGLPAVAYPNRGGSWDAATRQWAYGGALDLDLVGEWLAAGVRYVGGCCGTGPEDIAALADRLQG